MDTLKFEGIEIDGVDGIEYVDNLIFLLYKLSVIIFFIIICYFFTVVTHFI